MIFRRGQSIIRAVLCALGVLLAVSDLLAGVGSVMTFAPRTPINNGIQLEVDSRWIDGNGYRPVRIRLRSLAPNLADRQFRVVLRPQSWNPSVADAITAYIELNEGAATTEATILAPQDSLWQQVLVDVYEGGELLGDICPAHAAVSRTGNSWQWNQAIPGLLLIDADAPRLADRDQIVAAGPSAAAPAGKCRLPDFRNLAARLDAPNYGGSSPQANPVRPNTSVSEWELLRALGDHSRLELLPPAELPENWLAWSCFDVAFISLSDLQSFARDEPKKFAALATWLQAGHNLVVFGVGEQFEELAAIESQLALPPLRESPSAVLRGWSPASPKERDRQLQAITSALSLQNYRFGPTPGTSESFGAQESQWLAAGSKPPFAWRRAGLGYVVALAADEPFPGLGDDWAWLLASLPRENWRWEARHGVSLHQPNDHFYSFLIRGVGSVPVFTFLAFITVFVIAIGPVNYHYLRVRGRLSLLLLTVPAGACAVSAMLFCYALLADGLGVRARVRSVTWLDAEQGRFASHARQTYYAAISPSQGLRFPKDSAVYRIEAEPLVDGYQRSARRDLAWGDEQELRSGYVRSRTFSQLLVVNAGATARRLTIAPQGGAPQTAANRLGAAIRYLAVIREGECFSAERIAADATAPLHAVAWEQVRKRLSEAVNEFPLLPPDGLDPAAQRNRFFGLSSRMWMPNSPTPIPSQSLLESELARLREDPAKGLPRYFVALCERPELVPLGVPHAQLKDDLHLVWGAW